MPTATPAGADTNRVRTASARAEMLRKSARRAVDEPEKLARAVRIVRAALECERLTVEDLTAEDSTP